MSRPLGVLLALILLTLLAAPAAARAVAPPKAEVKTGLRVVATISYSSGIRDGKGRTEPAVRVAVRIFPEGGKKLVTEVKTDGKGVCVVALPAGKYRVEAVAPGSTPTRRLEDTVKVEVKEGAVSEVKLKFHYASQ